MVRWVVGSILHGVDPLSYFSSGGGGGGGAINYLVDNFNKLTQMAVIK